MIILMVVMALKVGPSLVVAVGMAITGNGVDQSGGVSYGCVVVKGCGVGRKR